MKLRLILFLALMLAGAGNAHAQFMGPGQRGGQTRNVYVTNTNTNGQGTMANSSPVAIASDQSSVAMKTASGAIASGSVASGAIASGAVASGAIAFGAVASGAFASGSIGSGAIASGAIAAGASAGDPCTFGTKVSLAISTNATASTQIIAASASTKIYVCSIILVAPAATAFNLLTGTGTNCGTSQAAVLGSTTAANGMSFAANGGITIGNGAGVIAIANVAGAELCTFQSNAVQVAGNLTYVQQ